MRRSSGQEKRGQSLFSPPGPSSLARQEVNAAHLTAPFAFFASYHPFAPSRLRVNGLASSTAIARREAPLYRKFVNFSDSAGMSERLTLQEAAERRGA